MFYKYIFLFYQFLDKTTDSLPDMISTAMCCKIINKSTAYGCQPLAVTAFRKSKVEKGA